MNSSPHAEKKEAHTDNNVETLLSQAHLHERRASLSLHAHEKIAWAQKLCDFFLDPVHTNTIAEHATRDEHKRYMDDCVALMKDACLHAETDEQKQEALGYYIDIVSHPVLEQPLGNVARALTAVQQERYVRGLLNCIKKIMPTFASEVVKVNVVGKLTETLQNTEENRLAPVMFMRKAYEIKDYTLDVMAGLTDASSIVNADHWFRAQMDDDTGFFHNGHGLISDGENGGPDVRIMSKNDRARLLMKRQALFLDGESGLMAMCPPAFSLLYEKHLREPHIANDIQDAQYFFVMRDAQQATLRAAIKETAMMMQIYGSQKASITHISMAINHHAVDKRLTAAEQRQLVRDGFATIETLYAADERATPSARQLEADMIQKLLETPVISSKLAAETLWRYNVLQVSGVTGDALAHRVEVITAFAAHCDDKETIQRCLDDNQAQQQKLVDVVASKHSGASRMDFADMADFVLAVAGEHEDAASAVMDHLAITRLNRALIERLAHM